MQTSPTRICCFRFDVDTHACVRRGTPRLLDLAESFGARFTFFVNTGRAFSRGISLRKNVSRLLATAREPRVSVATKLGLADSLTAMVFNPPVGLVAPPVLRVAALDGHEIGLLGGLNHATWERSAHRWSEERLYNELAAGLSALRACGVGQPVSFASPSWNSPAQLVDLLPALGFRVLADAHDADAAGPSPLRPGLTTVPINVTVPGSRAGYLEALRTRGLGRAEILADFRRQLAAKGNFAAVYEHPFYAALHDLPLLADLLRVATDEGFALRPIREAAAAAVPPRGVPALH